MKRCLLLFAIIMIALSQIYAQTKNEKKEGGMLIRISEIEVYPQYLDEYLTAAKNVGSTSVKEEEGVICIFPMQLKRDSSQIRIVEIYASDKAYKHHIQTDHFQKYKTGTLHMVKSLDLVDMNALDAENMQLIFKKMSEN